MISPRFIAVFAALAAVSAIPATDRPAIPVPITTINADEIHDDSPWFSFPLFGNLFAPIWKLFPSFADIGPKIFADDDKFQVVVNVKDYKKDDLKVKVKGDFIFVQGSHEAKQDDRDVFASQFFHTYTLPANSSSSDVSAKLTSDGYLIVTALLNGPVDRTKDTDREIVIVETGAPYQKEEKTENTTTSVVPTTVEDEKKEITTPAERDDVTEKDNIIPHGNEVQP